MNVQRVMFSVTKIVLVAEAFLPKILLSTKIETDLIEITVNVAILKRLPYRDKYEWTLPVP